MYKLFSNRKAASLDNFYVAIQFFGVALFLVGAMVIWNVFTSADIEEQVWNKTDTGMVIEARADRAFSNLDMIGLLVYFALHLGVLAMAFLLRTHPVVLVASFLLICFLAIISAPISNAYSETIGSTAELIAASATLPKVNFLMANLPKLEVIWAFLTAIVTFGLAKSEGFV